ncbi:hypothetical protein ACF06O_30605 [Streptomyces albidoflavus]
MSRRQQLQAAARTVLDTDRYGQITAGWLNMAGVAFDDGAVVVLEVGAGFWIRKSELEHIASALANVSHISITSAHSERGREVGHFGTIAGIDRIAAALSHLLAMPPMFDTA